MGIAFHLASAWRGDRAVLGLWSGRWFRIAEALQAQEILQTKRRGSQKQQHVSVVR